MYSRCTLYTHLSAPEALERLSRIVRPPRRLSQSVSTARTSQISPEAAFVGAIADHRFRIRRSIGHRNNFQPIIVGEISPRADGAMIDMTLRVGRPVGVIMTLWLAAAVFGSVAAVRHWLQGGAPRALLALFLPLFGALLILVGFVPEKQKAVNLLAKVFETTVKKRE